MKGIEFPGGSAPAFSVRLRLLILCAVALLAISTLLALLAARRLSPHPPGRAYDLQAAQLLAARAQAALTPLEIGVQSAADDLARNSADPLDAAERALRLAHPGALAAAVMDGDRVIAHAGPERSDPWADVARAARRSGLKLWIGSPAPPSGEARLVYVVATAPETTGAYSVALVTALDLLSLAPTHGVRVLASSRGDILEGAGVPSGAANLSVLGLDPARLAVSGDRGSSVLGGGGVKARVASASSPDGRLIAVLQSQGVGVQGERAVNLYSLAAPVLIGCGLLATLLFQTRRVTAARNAQGESERKFRLAVEAAHCGIWELRLRDQRMFMSDVTGVMLGWGGGGFVSTEDVIARIHPDHRDRVRKALQGAATFGAFDVSFCVPKADGGQAWIDARGQAFGKPDAQGYAALIGVALDVTHERKAEQRAQRAERRLRDAIDSVSEAFVLWDRQGRLLTCNQNYRDFFSLDPSVLKPGQSREMMQKMANLTVRQQFPLRQGRRDVLEAEMTDGRWLQISERRTADGGLVMTAADITAVKRQEEARRLNEEALQLAVERLEDSSRELVELAEKYQTEKIRAESANTAKSEFLANMSHELRTPLNAINGFSEMMVGEMFGPLGDRRYKEYVQDILTSGQHLLALINDILDMSKIEAGKLNLNLDWMDIGEVVDDAVRLMRNRAETANLDLVASIAPGLPEIEADYRAVKQVLLNLLSNALKFTPPGGRVEVKVWELGETTGFRRVRISVTDNGIGIAKHDIDRLGQPFAQIETQHSKTQQGSGLGLALTRSLIDMHDGAFELESEAGLGTTCTVTLPVQRVRPAVEAPPLATGGGLASA